MRIALADPRLAQSLDNPADLGGVVVEPKRSPIEYRRDGDIAYFTVGEHRKGLASEIGVRIDGDELVFFPQRSAGHRQLLQALGESE